MYFNDHITLIKTCSNKIPVNLHRMLHEINTKAVVDFILFWIHNNISCAFILLVLFVILNDLKLFWFYWKSPFWAFTSDLSNSSGSWYPVLHLHHIRQNLVKFKIFIADLQYPWRKIRNNFNPGWMLLCDHKNNAPIKFGQHNN